jgi:hypothetical protein
MPAVSPQSFTAGLAEWLEDYRRRTEGLEPCRGSYERHWTRPPTGAGELVTCRHCGHEVPAHKDATTGRLSLAFHGAAYLIGDRP